MINDEIQRKKLKLVFKAKLNWYDLSKIFKDKIISYFHILDKSWGIVQGQYLKIHFKSKFLG